MSERRNAADWESDEGELLSDEEFIRIRDGVEASFELPTWKRFPQIVLCPVGFIGAGKTTIITPLAKRLSLLRISTDEIRKRLKENGYNYKRTFEIATSLGEKYARDGYSIAIDADCASPYTQEFLNRLSSKLGAKLIWLHVNPPETFILHKLRTFKHTWLFRDADHAIKNYLARKVLHEKLEMPFFYTFDPSRDDLERQITEAAERIEHLIPAPRHAPTAPS